MSIMAEKLENDGYTPFGRFIERHLLKICGCIVAAPLVFLLGAEGGPFVPSVKWLDDTRTVEAYGARSRYMLEHLETQQEELAAILKAAPHPELSEFDGRHIRIARQYPKTDSGLEREIEEINMMRSRIIFIVNERTKGHGTVSRSAAKR